MLCDSYAARPRATRRRKPDHRTCHRRCENRIVRLRRKSGCQHASSATHELVLRIQAFHAPARAWDRAGVGARRWLDQRARIHDSFTSRRTRHLCLDLCWSKEWSHGRCTTQNLRRLLSWLFFCATCERFARYQLGEDNKLLRHRLRSSRQAARRLLSDR